MGIGLCGALVLEAALATGIINFVNNYSINFMVAILQKAPPNDFGYSKSAFLLFLMFIYHTVYEYSYEVCTVGLYYSYTVSVSIQYLPTYSYEYCNLELNMYCTVQCTVHCVQYMRI